MSMKKSNFIFVKDGVLRENIKNVYADIIELMMMVPSAKQQAQNCLRKTIIIYTASIIEALLLWKIQKEFGAKDVVMKHEWKYHAVKVIHSDNDFEVIGAKRSQEKRNSNRLDFNRMVSLCKDEKLLDKDLLKDIDEVRKLRNKLHIGGLKDVTKTYPSEDVKFVIKILGEIVQSIR